MAGPKSKSKDTIPDLRIAELYNVKGKVALVTGGATGLGKMIASTLAQNGAKVYIASRNLKQIQETAQDINNSISELAIRNGGVCIGLEGPLGTKEQADSLAKAFLALEPRLDLLFNNAGMSWGNLLTEFNEAKGWDGLMALNVKTPFYLTVALIPALEAAAKGDGRGNKDPARVVNISSVAGIVGMAETPLAAPGSGTWSYNASKAALNHLTRSMAISLAPKFISVNCIAPGFFSSKMTAYGIKHGLEALEGVQPLGRIGSTHDMAGLALFLSSRASAHLTGSVIAIDGGQALHGYSKL